MSATLYDYGLSAHFSRQLAAEELEEDRVARVTEVQRSQITVTNGVKEFPVRTGLTSADRDRSAEESPTVGDWIVLDPSRSNVERVLERKSVFRRVAAGAENAIQLIAANVDVLFIVTSCNEEFSESRLERYLALASESGVFPVIVLSKADLCPDASAYTSRALKMQPGVPVESINALDGQTLAGVRTWIEPGSTVALVGSSGVGKSTLLNALAEEAFASTRDVRQGDKKGRHTTSHRALYRVPGGGLIIDVPGMRELKVAELGSALGDVFDDIASAASKCRFKDCHHETEPGCAVREAVDQGLIDARRLSNYHKLLRENERNSATLAEQRTTGRSLARTIREAKAIKARGGGRRE